MSQKTADDRLLDMQALTSWAVITLLNWTLDLRTEGVEHLEWARRNPTGAIIIAWHGTTIIPVHFLRRLGVYAMASLSRDGEYVYRLFTRFGWKSIRGSTNEGGVRVMLQAMRCLRAGGLVGITPDGPRGPAGVVSSGTLHLASLTQAPLLCLGVGARRRHHLRTWDRYLIPYPFTTAAVVIAPPVWVPPGLDRRAVGAWQTRVRDVLIDAGRRAERLVLEAS